MAWFGSRTYVGASWTVARQADLSLTWTEITATNPFPSTVALALLLRDASGAFDPRFFATLTVPAAAQTSFLVRDMTIPNDSKGWFMLTSSPTPIVPSAVISVFRAASSHTEMLDVPIEQIDADGFPVGDGAAQPRAAGTPLTGSIQRPLATDPGRRGPLTTSTRARCSSSSGRRSRRRARSTRLGPSSTWWGCCWTTRRRSSAAASESLPSAESTGSSAMSGPAPENSRVPYGPQR